MSEPGEPGSRRGRIHDAKGAREAILNAAEMVFAEHGFDGARIDAIAEESGYNKSLLFQYFGDKLGLYAEGIKRAARKIPEYYVPLIQLTVILQICLSHLTYIPLYRMILPDEDLSSAAGLARAREYIVEFVVHGMMTDPKDDET